MQLTDTQIEDLQAIHQRNTGETLSVEETRAMGANLVNLIKLVYKPIKKVDYKNI